MVGPVLLPRGRIMRNLSELEYAAFVAVLECEWVNHRVSVVEIGALLDLEYAVASGALVRLVQRGLLKRGGAGRRFYVHWWAVTGADVFDLLQDEDVEVWPDYIAGRYFAARGLAAVQPWQLDGRHDYVRAVCVQ